MDGWCLRQLCSFTGLSLWFEGKEGYHGLNTMQVLLGRWLCCFSESIDAYCCIDLKSFRNGTEEKTTAYDCVTVPKCLLASNTFNAADHPIVAVLESLKDVPTYERTERDGYPVSCIKCGQDTTSGFFAVGNTTVGLGQAMCLHCMIRYSVSQKCWKCCKVVGENERDMLDCDGKLSPPEFQCTETHADVATSVHVRKRAKREGQDVVCITPSLNKEEADPS